MDTKIVETKSDAIEQGYMGYNECEHLLVSLDKKVATTISVRLPNGRKMAFAFTMDKKCDWACVDVTDDSLYNPDENMKILVMGRGPTYYVSKEDKVTVASVNLSRRDDL